MPNPIAGRHQDKVAIITGSGRGIGRGVARWLAREGARIVIAEYNAESAREAAQECAAAGAAETMAFPMNVSDVAEIEALVAAVVARWGRIDILVNNAGVNNTAFLLDVSPADWDRVTAVNQRGVFFCMQYVARQMIAQVPDSVKAAGRAAHSHGKIVNFSSIAGRGGRPYSAEYSASKWAVISMTQSAAAALAPYNINVNAVCPGVVHTPMWHYIDRVQAERFGLEPGEWFDKTVETIPLKRAGTPEDIAAAVSFLCSADADYITGQALNVDGGVEMN